MTAPIWMASPPEAHSALLSSGPGPAPLTAAAGAWNSLSAEYASAADELVAVLAAVQAGAWEGPSAESYVVAHAPYLAWLTQASANSAEAAAQHEVAAAAYTAALSAMPTLAELAANHAIHRVLVATNFFGINTIPIALNEADYVRMWIQAATTMATYQAVANKSVASTPQTAPAPQILKSDAATEPSGAANAASDPLQVLQQFLQEIQQIVQLPQLIGSQIFDRFLQAMGYTWNPANGTLNGIPYLSYNNPLSLIYWITRSLGYAQDFQTFVYALTTNPLQLLQSLGGLTPLQVIGYLALHPVLAVAIATSPLYSLSSVAPSAAAAASVAAVLGLVDIPTAAAPVVAPVLAPVAAVSHVLPAAGIAPTAAGSPGAAAPAAPASVAGTVTGSAPPSTPPPAQGFLPYAVGAGPGIGFGPGHTRTASSSAWARAPEPDFAAVAAAAAARRRSRRRRKQPEVVRGYADEFADLDSDVDPGVPPEAEASDRGAGPLGFAGTVSKESAQAAGLTVLAGDGFGGGPMVPLVPGTWTPDGEDG
jgi:PPE-repeat protein